MNVKGFTLVEMVMTIIIMGIIFIGVGSFIQLGSKGYIDTIDRQRLQNQARFVIEKLTREIRHSVPNSVSTFSDSEGDKCLSFYPIKVAGFYFRDEANRTIQFVVDNQGSKMSGSSGDRLVINPSQPADLTDNSKSVSLSSCLLSSQSDCIEQELSSGVFNYQVADNFASHSIAERYYRYSSLVSYCIASTGLMTKTIASGSKITVGNGLDFSTSNFKYKNATLQRGGLVHMDLKFINDTEESFYKQDVQVLNVP